MRYRKVVNAVLLATIAAVAAVPAHGAPPKNPEFLRSEPGGFRPCRVMTEEMRASLQKRGALRTQGQRGVIAPTTKKIIAIRVEFAGGPTFTQTKAQTEAFFSEVRAYYLENSYGLFETSVTVSNNEYLLAPVSFYNNETDSSLLKLRNDALAAADGDINFAAYDYVMIYHAGLGQEESGAGADIWSLFFPGNFMRDGKLFDGFTVVPELSRAGSSSLGVICHEFGHQLGLPDLYDTSVIGGRSTCGAWSLMDYPYGYDNTGRNPPHLDPWCKNYLKFIDLDASARTVSVTIPNAFMGDIQTSQSTGYYVLPVDASGGTEYFVVENRSPDPAKTTYDLSLPGAGLLIWHIDDAIALDAARSNKNTINTGVPHLGIDLVEADGTAKYSPLPGEPTDAFVGGDIFSSPLSNSFSGQLTDITLTNIAFSGDTAHCSIRKIASSPSLVVNRVINYPNPAGKGYFHPRQGSGVLTTIVFQSTRPPRDMVLTIYDLAGNIVRTVSRDRFALNLGPSTDLKWIFEYDWNGRNDNDEEVASGIYLYRIKADDEIRLGKIAVVR